MAAALASSVVGSGFLTISSGSFQKYSANGVRSIPSVVGSSASSAARAAPFAARNSREIVACSALQQQGKVAEPQSSGSNNVESSFGRREAVMSGMTLFLGGMIAVGPALADFNEDYQSETQAVIDRVKSTLSLEKSDPSKSDAVALLRQISNDWVAKYRREKAVSGKASYSNIYSVLNAISGHYISFGNNYPIPVKRKDRILEEVRDAEKALKRGR